jgi:phenylalanyl-tRNA synthetase alpha chain
MKEKIEQIRSQFKKEASSVNNAQSLENVRIQFLGRKGLVTDLFKMLGKVSPEERPQIGKMLNELRREIEEKLAQLKEQYATTATTETIDMSLPGRKPRIGRLHPLTQIRMEIKKIFSRLGFSVAEGPEVESDYYNFEALNTPKLHPARSMQDTFYISEELMLRTHTSPVQIRTMEQNKPPIRIIAPGRVYRRDTPDASHSPVFHQVEGLYVDEGVSMSDLKAILATFAREMFGKDAKVRFRPSFFPFTEPSAEVDIWWQSAKGGKWLEIMGCGMVDPNVLKMVGLDPDVYSGWAFGMGIDRIAMLKYGLKDIRLFFDNDMRFLEQFTNLD